MLDNFGMGEFLVLAFFALLFFGPERLPQIGAQLGRWLSKLTGYSKAFMNQWSEEAAAVQGAVQDVMAIRDEIRSAQAEIAQTLNDAQKDINDTITEARGTVQAATPTAAGFAASATDGAPALASAKDAERYQARESAAKGGDDSEAVSKTQEIVNALLEKQGIAPPTEESPDEPSTDETPTDLASAEAPETDEPLAAADASDVEETTEDDEYQRNLQAIEEIWERSKSKPASSGQPEAAEEPAEPAEVEGKPEAAVTGPTETMLGPIAATQQAQSKPEPEKEKGESAFDKTQRILNQLMGIEPEPEPEPEPDEPSESPEQEPPQQAQAPDDGAAETERELEAAAPLQAPVTQALRDVDAVQHVRSPENGISKGEFTKLSIEVTLLKKELRALREELQTLRTEAPAQGQDRSSGLPVEEVA